MPATATTITPSRSSGPSDAPGGRRPFRDNPRLILAGIGVLLIALVAIVALANRSTRYSPDFLSEVVLYALTAADLTMLVALVFVLARNIVKLVVERRRGLLFARFRFKLVALLLGMTLVPAILVLAVGSELLQASVERWFNAPMDDILASANRIAGDYYQERQLMPRRRRNAMPRSSSCCSPASTITSPASTNTPSTSGRARCSSIGATRGHAPTSSGPAVRLPRSSGSPRSCCRRASRRSSAARATKRAA